MRREAIAEAKRAIIQSRRRAVVRRVCACMLLTMAVAACGDAASKNATRSGDSAVASSSASGTDGRTVRGHFAEGDEQSDWMRTVDHDGAISIEDDARFGENGVANRVFTFTRDGTLRRASEQRTQMVFAGNQSPTTQRTELLVDFTASPPTATKMVDDVRRDVQPYEIDNLRRRAETLRAQSGR